MKFEEIKQRCRNIKYELKKGTHTFTMCKCGRHGCRTEKCWECNLDEIFNNKLSIRKGCGKEICQVPDVLVCGEDTNLDGEIILCDDCEKKYSPKKTGVKQ